jgi:type IV pilus assembly protein PilP
MTWNRILSHCLYLVVGIMSLSMAVFLATRVMRHSHSQNTTQVLPPPPVSTAPPSTAAPAAATTPSATATAISESAFLEPYVFDMREGRRNPFRPPQIGEGMPSDVVLPGTPLERYELDELKLVGIIWEVKAPKAMIIDPQGDVHVIGKDDRIGRKHGYIAVIREGEVVVVETTTFNGENTYSTRVMRITK